MTSKASVQPDVQGTTSIQVKPQGNVQDTPKSPPEGSIAAMVQNEYELGCGHCCCAPSVKYSELPEWDSRTLDRKLGDVVGKGPSTAGCCEADPDALQQPGFCGIGICCHEGTTEYPAKQLMLDANSVAGTYQDPGFSCGTTTISPCAALGFLWTTHWCGPCPCACYCLPFNCAGPCTCSQATKHAAEGAQQCCGGLGRGGTPIAVFYCPTHYCLPGNCTLAGTWFCCPASGVCMDWHDPDTMLCSICCCCNRVHRKIKQGKTLW